MAAPEVAETSDSQRHGQASEAASPDDRSAVSPLAAQHGKVIGKVIGKCSACAACCTVAFLPTTVIAFNAPAVSRALPGVELTARVGFFTDGPDRPPRLPLA